jgi:hypothetical protein
MEGAGNRDSSIEEGSVSGTRVRMTEILVYAFIAEYDRF